MEKQNELINEIIQVEAEVLHQHIGEVVRIHGSIYKIRKMSDFAFVLLRTKRSVVQGIYSGEYSEFPLEKLAEESAVIWEKHSSRNQMLNYTSAELRSSSALNKHRTI